MALLGQFWNVLYKMAAYDILHKSFFFLFTGESKVGWLVVGVKADCLSGDLGLWIGCPPWGSF